MTTFGHLRFQAGAFRMDRKLIIRDEDFVKSFLLKEIIPDKSIKILQILSVNMRLL